MPPAVVEHVDAHILPSHNRDRDEVVDYPLHVTQERIETGRRELRGRFHRLLVPNAAANTLAEKINNNLDPYVLFYHDENNRIATQVASQPRREPTEEQLRSWIGNNERIAYEYGAAEIAHLYDWSNRKYREVRDRYGDLVEEGEQERSDAQMERIGAATDKRSLLAMISELMRQGYPQVPTALTPAMTAARGDLGRAITKFNTDYLRERFTVVPGQGGNTNQFYTEMRSRIRRSSDRYYAELHYDLPYFADVEILYREFAATRPNTGGRRAVINKMRTEVTRMRAAVLRRDEIPNGTEQTAIDSIVTAIDNLEEFTNHENRAHSQPAVVNQRIEYDLPLKKPLPLMMTMRVLHRKALELLRDRRNPRTAERTELAGHLSDVLEKVLGMSYKVANHAAGGVYTDTTYEGDTPANERNLPLTPPAPGLEQGNRMYFYTRIAETLRGFRDLHEHAGQPTGEQYVQEMTMYFLVGPGRAMLRSIVQLLKGDSAQNDPLPDSMLGQVNRLDACIEGIGSVYRSLQYIMVERQRDDGSWVPRPSMDPTALLPTTMQMTPDQYKTFYNAAGGLNLRQLHTKLRGTEAEKEEARSALRAALHVDSLEGKVISQNPRVRLDARITVDKAAELMIQSDADKMQLIVDGFLRSGGRARHVANQIEQDEEAFRDAMAWLWLWIKVLGVAVVYLVLDRFTGGRLTKVVTYPVRKPFGYVGGRIRRLFGVKTTDENVMDLQKSQKGHEERLDALEGQREDDRALQSLSVELGDIISDIRELKRDLKIPAGAGRPEKPSKPSISDVLTRNIFLRIEGVRGELDLLLDRKFNDTNAGKPKSVDPESLGAELHPDVQNCQRRVHVLRAQLTYLQQALMQEAGPTPVAAGDLVDDPAGIGRQNLPPEKRPGQRTPPAKRTPKKKN